MFPYDPVLCGTAATPPKSIAEGLDTFEKIQSICIDGDLTALLSLQNGHSMSASLATRFRPLLTWRIWLPRGA
jgi:hypothetical protein